ncbi:RNase H domain-containing family protein [Cucumis melo var. makuwa]|uniref:RNase H domain-containing family protein n=1 Tax=Cucumis melo var. makuwa TaxID=1194695 RepID=A0A5D3D2K9_CUCMM|nr:RNase H domain-containing family protein [Cucumis melo var. makuwa]
MSKGLGSRILELLCLWLIYHVPIPLFFQHHVVLGHSAQIGNGWDLASPANDPNATIYKGYHLSKEAEEYLVSHGLQSATYSISAANVTKDLFGKILPCFPYEQPSTTRGKMAEEYPKAERQERVLKNTEYTYFLEFDGASKGNPGLAGAGAILRANDGSTVCRLQEGVGIATCNVAEYRAIILGLKHALKNGIKHIYVQGDSKLVCMQVQGLWKLKNQNMAELCKVAKELKDKFVSFEISHVPRNRNSDADALANRAIHLQDGVVVEDCIHK